MIEWYQELYQDACTQKKWKKIRRKAEKGKPVSPGIKFICLALGAVGIANMWLAIFADVGVLVIAVLNAIRALQVQNV